MNSYYDYCITYIQLDKAAAIKIQLELKMRAYVDSDYRPTAWLAFMMTSKPAETHALPTMLPRLNSDNVVLTQIKQVRRAAKETGRAGQPKVDDIPPPPKREVIMYHKLAHDEQKDPIVHLKRKLDAYATQIGFLQEAGHLDEVRKYKRLQLEVSTAMCEALAKLDELHVPSPSNTVIDLLNSSTSSPLTVRNNSSDDNVYSI